MRPMLIKQQCCTSRQRKGKSAKYWCNTYSVWWGDGKDGKVAKFVDSQDDNQL